MPVIRTYRCPECLNTFEVFHESYKEGPPEACHACGTSFGGVALPPKINIGGSNVAKSVDQTWEMLSQDRYDPAGNLHKGITNMKDNLRQGDVAAMPPPVNNTVTQYARAAEQQFGTNPIGFAAGGTVGTAPADPSSTGMIGAIQGAHNAAPVVFDRKAAEAAVKAG